MGSLRERFILNICTGKWKTKTLFVLFLTGLGYQTLKTKGWKGPCWFMWRSCFSNLVKLNLFQTEIAHEMHLVHLPTSQTQLDLSLWCEQSLLSCWCSGPWNQREPVCPGRRLIWPCHLPQTFSGQVVGLAVALTWRRESPLLKASHTTSVTGKKQKSEPAVCWPFNDDPSQ